MSWGQVFAVARCLVSGRGLVQIVLFWGGLMEERSCGFVYGVSFKMVSSEFPVVIVPEGSSCPHPVPRSWLFVCAGFGFFVHLIRQKIRVKAQGLVRGLVSVARHRVAECCPSWSRRRAEKGLWGAVQCVRTGFTVVGFFGFVCCARCSRVSCAFRFQLAGWRVLLVQEPTVIYLRWFVVFLFVDSSVGALR